MAILVAFFALLILPNIGGQTDLLPPEEQAIHEQLTIQSEQDAVKSSTLDTAMESLLDTLGSVLVIVALIALALILLYGFYYNYAKAVPNAVRVSEKNFPEIYAKSVEFAQKLGMKKVPAVYIGQHNGVLNAFAAWVLGKRYVFLNSEIVDIAYMDEHNFEGVYFVMGHEFGHLHFHHATFWYNFSKFLVSLVPLLGVLLTRAQEYSADRVAQVLTGQDGLRSMSVMTAGRHLYRHIDLEDYTNTLLYTDHRRFLERLSIFIVNLLATHPVTPYRFEALIDPQMRSGRLI